MGSPAHPLVASAVAALRRVGQLHPPADAERVAGAEAAARRDRVAGARAVVAERELALDRAAQGLPRALRARPRWWEIWLWPVRWILARFRRRAMTELQFSTLAAKEATRALQ